MQGADGSGNQTSKNIEILTKQEAATLARISERTLDRLLEDGRGPRRIALSKRRVGFCRTDFFDWLVSRIASGGK